MDKFRPIKKLGMGLERWKDEKTGKERRKTGLLTPRKIRKSGKTSSKKEKKRKKPRKRKIFFKWERVSFRSRYNKFSPAHISRYNLEIRHIPSERNPADTLSRQDKKDALERKTVVHDTNVNLVKELRVPSDADDVAIQEARMKLFNDQVRDQIESVAVEGQASRAKRSIEDQVLKALDSVSDQFSPDQPESESKSPRSVQFKSDVSVSSSSQSSSQCTLAVGTSSINIDDSLRDRIHFLL